MSSIYAGGVHATAISNITSAITSRIVTQADGTKVLNVQDLLTWIRAQFRQMITDGEATSSAYIGGLDATAAAQTCADVIAPTHWQARPDWPLHTNTASTQQSASVAGVLAQQAKLKNLAAAATAFYADTPDLMANTIADYFTANVEAAINPGVQLLEENRAYIVTYVTDRDEESAPSPASDLIQLDQNDTVAVTVPAAPSGRNITHFRLYRSNTTNTSADFAYVPCASDADGWPIGTLTITDDKIAAELQEPCPSLLWDEPPADLRGLVAGAGGGMAGFTGNDFCPCVPYVPYAFPAALRITTEWPIVGLASLEQAYFVGTRGRPYLVSGADTQSLIPLKLDADQPCVAKRGIVAMRGGFVYPSPDGLCYCSLTGAVKVITGPEGFNLFDRESWQALVPSSIVAAEYEGAYVFQWNNGSTTGAYALDVTVGKMVALSTVGSALFRDSITDRLYVASSLAISAMFASATKRTAAWKTKVIALDDYPSFAWMQAQSNYESSGTITVNLYGDGVLIQTATLSSRNPLRVVPGTHREWEVEIQSACRITSFTLASNTEELKAA
jgi:hypothetical protein